MYNTFMHCNKKHSSRVNNCQYSPWGWWWVGTDLTSALVVSGSFRPNWFRLNDLLVKYFCSPHCHHPSFEQGYCQYHWIYLFCPLPNFNHLPRNLPRNTYLETTMRSYFVFCFKNTLCNIHVYFVSLFWVF